MPRPDHVFRVKITLLDVKPPIWRRIEILDEATFWDLHVAIQDAMGWLDCHLHQFTMPRLPSEALAQAFAIGIPDDFNEGVMPGWEIEVAEFLNLADRRVNYDYDFGDGWRHSVLLEQIRPLEKGETAATYPRCIGGRRACPIEDIGGPFGYEEALATWKAAGGRVADEDDRASMIPPDFEPDRFDPATVRFSDPEEALDQRLEAR